MKIKQVVSLLLVFCFVQYSCAEEIVKSIPDKKIIDNSNSYLIANNTTIRSSSMNNQKIIQLTDFEESKLLWHDTLYIVKMNNKWGIFNNYSHEFFINPEYDSLDVLEGIWWIRVSKNGKYGLYNGRDLILDIQYDSIEYSADYKLVKNAFNPFTYEYDKYLTFIIRKNNKYALGVFHDDEKKLQIPDIQYDDIKMINRPLLSYKVSKNGKYALWRTGDFKITTGFKSKFLYDDIIGYFEGTKLLIITNNSKKGLYSVNKKREISKIIYDDFEQREVSYNDITGFYKYGIYGKKEDSWEKIYSYSEYNPKQPNNPYL